MGPDIALFDPLRHDAFQKQGQVTPVDTTASVGYKELPFFQTFIPQCQTVLVPVKQFDHFAVAVDEHKQGTGQRVHRQFGADDAAQTVEGFAHVAGAPVKIDARGGGQGNHQDAMQARTDRRVRGSKFRCTSMQRLPDTMRMPVSWPETEERSSRNPDPDICRF